MYLQYEKYPDTVHDWAQNYLVFAKHRNLETQWSTVDSLNDCFVWQWMKKQNPKKRSPNALIEHDEHSLDQAAPNVRMFYISLFLFSRSCHFCPLSIVFHVFWVLCCRLPCVPLVFSRSSPVCFSFRTCSASSSLAQPCSQCASQPYNSLPTLLGFYTRSPRLCYSTCDASPR